MRRKIGQKIGTIAIPALLTAVAGQALIEKSDNFAANGAKCLQTLNSRLHHGH